MLRVFSFALVLIASVSLLTTTQAESFAPADRKAPTTRPAARKSNTATRTKPPIRHKVAARKKKKKKKGRVLKHWLQWGPAPLPFPVFAKEKGGKFTATALLKQQPLHVAKLAPRAGKKTEWFTGQSWLWKKTASSKAKAKGKLPQVLYYTLWVRTARYTKLALQVRSHQRLQILLGSRVIGTKARCTTLPKKKKKAASKAKKKKAASKTKTKSKKTAAQAKQRPTTRPVRRKTTKAVAKGRKSTKKRKPRKPGLARARLHLHRGLHQLTIKVLWTPRCKRDLSFKATLKANKGFPKAKTLQVTAAPDKRYSMNVYFHRKRLGAMKLSPDGRWLLVSVSQYDRKGQMLRWLEQRDAETGELLRRSNLKKAPRDLQWSPDGKSYTFITYHRGKGSIWLYNIRNSSQRRLLTGVKGLVRQRWVPNGRSLVVMTYKKKRASKMLRRGFKLLKGMEDRWPWSRNRYFLHLLNVNSGARVRLTAGRLNPSLLSFHPKGHKLLFARGTKYDYSSYPFYRSNVYELDLRTFKTRILLKGLKFFAGASYSPDGSKLLVLGGPSLFGKLGHSPALRPGQVPNEYDRQAYLYDLKTKKKQALTRTFSPHIRAAYWHPIDKHIYFSVLDRTSTRLFRYDLKKRIFTKIYVGAGVDIISRVRFSKGCTQFVYQGSGVSMPQRLYSMEITKLKPKMIYAPNAALLKGMALARVKFWSFKNRRGESLDGRIYFPVGFNPTRKYPTVVYYYGGTFPTLRTFDGSYSGQWWASQGYLVLILQPSGAIGFGQRFSAYHSNEWGTIVPYEIIDGVKQYLQQHTFAAPKRVGCIGASYGGFTTMSVVTRTKMFGAAVSHAGISNIASYWGVGFWGYLYNTRSAPRRYPWTHPNFYRDQSPLYNAHKVRTPLLLTHGMKDTNVPPGESLQMYAALKLLKRPVELLMVKGENHGIYKRNKRRLWMRSIVAFFDRHLKQQPQWWEALYGKLPKTKKKKKKSSKK